MAGLAFDHLRPQEQETYCRLLELLGWGITTFGGRELGVAEPLTVLQAVTADHPELIWFAPSTVQERYSLLGKQVSLLGVITGRRRRVMERELETGVNRALSEIRNQGPVTDYDKLLCIYEYIQKAVVYDEEEKTRALSTGKDDFLSHNAYGALVRGRAVCDGIAAGFCLLARRLGLRACTLSGKAAQGNRPPMGHTWALVELGGVCCHLDPTWELSRQNTLGVPGYDYFCLDDITISMDHDWDTTRAPRCRSMELSYFHKNRLYANNLTQARQLLERLARTRAGVLRLRLAEGAVLPGPDENQAMGKLLQEACTAAGKVVSFHYSWNPEVRTLTCVVRAGGGQCPLTPRD